MPATEWVVAALIGGVVGMDEGTILTSASGVRVLKGK
jgi:hypothetical protein